MKLKIVDVNHSIANRFADGTIEINKYLKNYPELYGPILKHEFGHTNKTFSWFDMKHDINSSDKVNQAKLIKFMFKHPKSFTQLLPFYYSKTRNLVVDINLTIIYSIIVSIGLAIFLFIF